MSFSSKFPLILFFASSLLFQATLGEIVCEELPKNVCSYSIASSGKRCLLENVERKNNGEEVEYECKTSDVVVQRIVEHIETDQCVDACGLDRNTVGLSSDSLLEPHLTARLCSPDCYYKCPNIVDLYFNLAAGEGVFLPDLCEKRKTNPYRAMLELMNGPANAAPESEETEADAPSPSNASDETKADTPAPSSEDDEDASPPSSENDEEADAPAPSSGSEEDEENAPTPSGEDEEADIAPAPADESEDASAPASETEEEALSPSSDEADAPAPESGSDDEDAPAAPESGNDEGEEDTPAPSPTSESDEADAPDSAPAPEHTGETDDGDA